MLYQLKNELVKTYQNKRFIGYCFECRIWL